MAFLLYFIVNVGSNLIDNPSFEAPLVQSWYFRADSATVIIVDETNSYAGKRCLKISNSDSTDKKYHACNQEIHNFTRESWYTLICAMKYSNANGIVAIDVHFINSTGKRLPKYDAKIALYPRGESTLWHVYSVDFNVPKETAKIIIALYLKGWGTIYFDSLSLVKQEPNSKNNRSPSKGVYLLRKNDPVIWFEYAEQKVYKDDPYPAGEVVNMIMIKGARGEYEAFQIVVRTDKDIEDISFEFSDAICFEGTILSKSAFSVLAVEHVNVERASTPHGFTGLTPDVLKPQSKFFLQSGVNNSFWISLRIPNNIPAGSYHGEIKIKRKNHAFARIPLQVTVWDFMLPSISHLYVRSNFWLSLVRKYDSRSSTEILHDYYSNLKIHRINAFGQIPLETKIVGSDVVCSFDKFDRYVSNLFNNYGFEALTIGPFLGDANGWTYRRKWMGVDPESGEFTDILTQYCKKLEDHLSDKEWLDRCWISYWDEPQLGDPDLYKIIEIGRVIKKAAPKLKIFMTIWPTSEFIDVVDIWCVPFSRAAFHQEKVKARQDLGELIFVYHNDPYIDTPLINKRLYAWQYKLAGVDGVYAWWNLTYWLKNPYEGPSAIEDKRHRVYNYLKAGDGVLLYPNPKGKGPPINSIRWEVFRQGLEDYEYLWLLEKNLEDIVRQLKTKAQFKNYPKYRIEEIIRVILVDYFYKDWQGDVKDVYDIRDRISHEIIETGKAPFILIKTIPPEGDEVVNQKVKVEGITEEGASVFINDVVIEVRRNGTFFAEAILGKKNYISIVVSFKNKEKEIRRFFQRK
ncbi:DUF4091 domain-containing protein [candidate division WOR-3 bacterium]|nr:DUF4091 domain-containing protein [candidate division WOR-3 bacterium]